MVDFFDDLYAFAGGLGNKGLKWKLFRLSVRLVANIVLPIYFILTSKRKKYKLPQLCKDHPHYIVSLTSFPARIKTIWMVVETLLRQTKKPDRIVLWLSKDQFASINDLPSRLLKLRRRGLEIYIKEGDLKSHKKYYYTMSEFPSDVCIVVDDDVFYRSNLLDSLISMHNLYPKAICCNLADKIIDEEEKILPFDSRIILEADETVIYSDKLLAIGVGGVLYPPNVLNNELLNKDIFMTICPRADDLWLWAMGKKNHAYWSYSGMKLGFLPVMIPGNIKLATDNLAGGNDSQLLLIKNHCGFK